MKKGVIVKALSGFYYVNTGDETLACRAKGRFRYDGLTPLVGDSVVLSDEGVLEAIEPRRNSFIRPAVANIDLLIFVASKAKPVTDPFLIDRVSVIAEDSNCDFAVCINKNDLEKGDDLFDIYKAAGYPVLCLSAETGEGIEELRSLMKGRICAFTGNSGVGKSSLLNALIPGAGVEVAEISDKLGRGKHTTRHVAFYALDEDTYVADTPGFASFEIEMMNEIGEEELARLFIDFGPYPDRCRFDDCRHINEPGCAVKEAVESGQIMRTRYDSYLRLYDIVKNHKPW